MSAKKVLLSIALLVGVSTSVNAEIPSYMTTIQLHLIDVHPTRGGKPIRRTPMRAPEVGVDDYTLYFAQAYSEVVAVELCDESDGVVYSASLLPGMEQLELPTTLSGSYTLFIYIGDCLYAGEFEF